MEQVPGEGWDEEEDQLLREFPLRVHRYRNSWVCMCRQYGETGKCRHLVAYLPKEDVDVKEEYL